MLRKQLYYVCDTKEGAGSEQIPHIAEFHDKLEALVRVLEPFGIKELVKSGTIAVGRGGRSITDRTLRPLERSA